MAATAAAHFKRVIPILPPFPVIWPNMADLARDLY
jgi:hypothetical protein